MAVFSGPAPAIKRGLALGGAVRGGLHRRGFSGPDCARTTDSFPHDPRQVHDRLYLAQRSGDGRWVAQVGANDLEIIVPSNTAQRARHT